MNDPYPFLSTRDTNNIIIIIITYITNYIYIYDITEVDMGRPIELKTRVARNVIFENDELKEFEEIVGKDNVSREIRALLHKFLEEQKKGEASLNPLNLARHSLLIDTPLSNNNNISLDIYLLSQSEINKKLGIIRDRQTLVNIKTKTDIISDICRTSIKNIMEEERKILR